jgi:PTH1 family peptidyl-tRNA hydrolase
MKYLIVGLGNPGFKYENTRHNVGFKVLERLIEGSKTIFEVEKLGNVARHKFKGRTILLLQPSTFMNLSGKAVNYWMQKEKIPIENILIITDDLSLPFGTLRLKGKGSDAGHNGLKDIAATLNTTKYARLKFGVGADFSEGKQVDYVLGDWNSTEKKTLDERLDMSCEFIKGFASIGLNRTMNEFNGK